MHLLIWSQIFISKSFHLLCLFSCSIVCGCVLHLHYRFLSPFCFFHWISIDRHHLFWRLFVQSPLNKLWYFLAHHVRDYGFPLHLILSHYWFLGQLLLRHEVIFFPLCLWLMVWLDRSFPKAGRWEGACFRFSVSQAASQPKLG